MHSSTVEKRGIHRRVQNDAADSIELYDHRGAADRSPLPSPLLQDELPQRVGVIEFASPYLDRVTGTLGNKAALST
ncbi:hypothetical protein [Kocuria rosea]|uniref:hypothetical protein n=1 Tax=Kocuria rosea TaxID=1275 RepID=UPI002B252DF4|nr:hypothetical protein [Kocuria rosea]MEB2529115.1 hypothetical protein [Kocuria rosea]MEB2619445.1 hypothetical protein [Kocuria rosea]